MRIISTKNCLLGLLCFLLSVPLWCNADDNKLSCTVPVKGGDIVQIVIADPCDPVQKSCAEDIQRIFALVTKKTVGIATTPFKGRCLFIGCAPKGIDLSQQLAKLGDEGIYLNITPKFIICTGRTPQGIYNTVQELLYQIGYRDIWPGKYGECLPDILDLSKTIEIIYNPSFELRGGKWFQVEVQPGQKQLTAVDSEKWVDWAAKNHINRFKPAYNQTWDYGAARGHGWQEIDGHTCQDIFLPADEFGKGRTTEWYALFKGKRVATHPIGTTAEPCISNPEFIDFVTNTIREYFTKHPDAKRYMIAQADEPSYWCTCDRCRAWDPKQIDCNWTPYGPQGNLQPRQWHMADRWLRFVNLVAKCIEKEFPNKWIATYSYSGTMFPPIEVIPNRNVMVEVTIPELCRKHSLLDTNCPDNQMELRRIQSWSKISNKISIYSYLEFDNGGIPISFFHSASDLYKSVYNIGVRHISDEMDSNPYISPVYFGLWGRLLWDVNTAPDKYISEFCNIVYGNAGQEMEQFWRYQGKVMLNSKLPHRGYKDIERFTPEVFKVSYELLQNALCKKLTQNQVVRIQRARMSILMAEFYTSKAMINEKTAKAWLQACKCKEEIFQLADKYGFSFSWWEWNALGGRTAWEDPNSDNAGYIFPREAIEGEILVSLPETWLFRTDPHGKGEKDQWYSKDANMDEYKPISILKNWEAQWVGDYDGYGWYVTEVTIPKTAAKHVWLLFGAVDETWKAWIDGKYIGAGEGNPNKVWNMPSAVDISGKYTLGQKVRITVRVHDTIDAGGIWQPVTITTNLFPDN